MQGLGRAQALRAYGPKRTAMIGFDPEIRESPRITPNSTVSPLRDPSDFLCHVERFSIVGAAIGYGGLPSCRSAQNQKIMRAGASARTG